MCLTCWFFLYQDVDYYTRAWELSESQSSRAQRSLGLWHLKREEYKESVECLQKSLAVNSLQAGVLVTGVAIVVLVGAGGLVV